MTPLQTRLLNAVRSNQVDKVQMMLSKGADPNDVEDKYGWSPLHYAAGNGFHTMLQVLVDAGGDPALESNDGLTPLHYAAMQGFEATMTLLCSLDAVDMNARDHEGLTPLHHAARTGSSSSVTLLLSVQADDTVIDMDGLTPFDFACGMGHSAIVALLA